jgi:hypothetical protein
MAKLVFSQANLLDMTRRLQLLLLDAVMASGNWSRQDIRFQGGTCLSLVYGSGRFSEDLDFVLGTDRGLNRMFAGVAARMNNALRAGLPGAVVRFATKGDDLESDATRNPRAFTMTISHPDWYRTVKVKAEFWLCDPEAVKRYGAGVRTANVLGAAADGVPLRLAISPVLVNAADREEIVVDKLHALVGRRYLKHRDVFDLWWLAAQGLEDWSGCLRQHYENHARMHAASPRLEELGPLLRSKATEIAALTRSDTFSKELKRWLGSDSQTATRPSADAIADVVAKRVTSCAIELAKERVPRSRTRGRER